MFIILIFCQQTTTLSKYLVEVKELEGRALYFLWRFYLPEVAEWYAWD